VCRRALTHRYLLLRHCSYSTRSRVYVTARCPSVCALSIHRSAACGGFADGRAAGRRCRSTAAAPSSTVFSSKCEQCRVYSRRRTPNTNRPRCFEDCARRRWTLTARLPLHWTAEDRGDCVYRVATNTRSEFVSQRLV